MKKLSLLHKKKKFPIPISSIATYRTRQISAEHVPAVCCNYSQKKTSITGMDTKAEE